MRLPVYNCHQVVINASQFDFRENNEAFVYLLPTGLQQHALGKRENIKLFDLIMTVKTLVGGKKS